MTGSLCGCGRTRPGPFVPGDCYLCWLEASHPAYAAAAGRPAPADPRPAPGPDDSVTPLPRPPCRHLGEPAGWGRMQALGLSPIRDWRDCAKGHGTAGVVCGCKTFPAGCRGCPDYVPSDDEE